MADAFVQRMVHIGGLMKQGNYFMDVDITMLDTSPKYPNLVIDELWIYYKQKIDSRDLLLCRPFFRER